MSSIFNFKYQVDTDNGIIPVPTVDKLDESFMETFDSKLNHYAGDKDLLESNIERTGNSLNVFNLNLTEKADFEAAVKKSKNDAAYRASLTGAKPVKGKGYDDPNKTIEKASFTFPELTGVFAAKTPDIKGNGRTVAGRAMSGDKLTDMEDDSAYPKPHNQHKDATAVHAPGSNQEPMDHTTPLDLAVSIHDQISRMNKAIAKHIAVEHIRAALSKYDQKQILSMANSPLGRKTLRGFNESASFTTDWKIEILKEGNLHKYFIKDEDDVIAEGVNLTYDGAMKLAVRNADELAAQIEEQVMIMQEEKEFEDGKYTRILKPSKN